MASAGSRAGSDLRDPSQPQPDSRPAHAPPGAFRARAMRRDGSSRVPEPQRGLARGGVRWPKQGTKLFRRAIKHTRLLLLLPRCAKAAGGASASRSCACVLLTDDDDRGPLPCCCSKQVRLPFLWMDVGARQLLRLIEVLAVVGGGSNCFMLPSVATPRPTHTEQQPQVVVASIHHHHVCPLCGLDRDWSQRRAPCPPPISLLIAIGSPTTTTTIVPLLRKQAVLLRSTGRQQHQQHRGPRRATTMSC